jgi:predicted GNAT family acetyltransferase
LRRATEDDAALVLAWFGAFHAEADEQAGREPDPSSGEHNTLESVLVRIREGVEWLWELPDGTVAHLTGSGLPSFGVRRIGPVFTPREHRGRGIASYVVGELTRRGLDAGHRMCLFTDLANPTSNKIYSVLGYEPVVDMAEHLVTRPRPHRLGSP